MSLLSHHLNQANTQNLTQQQIVKEAAGLGLSISQTTVSRYLGGLHPTPASRRVLEVFSKVFHIPLGELVRLGGLPEELGVFELPAKAQVLDRGERDMVLALVSFLADRKAQQAEAPLAVATAAPVSGDHHSPVLTPEGTVFDPVTHPDHRYLLETYGPSWPQHYYDLIARRQDPESSQEGLGEGTDEDYPRYLGGSQHHN